MLDLVSASSGSLSGFWSQFALMFGSGMGNSAQTEPVVRFQDFQVNLETGEVWKAGVRLKVQDQPFKG